MLIAIHKQSVIDLIRENDELVLSSNLYDSLEDLLRINGTGRIIGVDDDDRLGLVRDLALDVRKIRIPVTLLIAQLMNDVAACQCRARCPERIIRCRDENLISVLKQG